MMGGSCLSMNFHFSDLWGLSKSWNVRKLGGRALQSKLKSDTLVHCFTTYTYFSVLGPAKMVKCGSVPKSGG